MDAVPATAGRIFISYRREETAYPAGWLFDNLADRFGPDQVFKDVDSIAPGDDFIEVINDAVGSCDVLLALIGNQWLTITNEDGGRRIDDPNDFVRLEIQAALARNVRVIPVLVDEARMPREEDLPPAIAKLVRRQALELSPSHFAHDVGRLLKVLDRTLTDAHAQAVVREPEPKPLTPERSPPEPYAADERRTTSALALSLSPVAAGGRRSSKHELRVANHGGDAVGVELSVDGSDELDIEVAPRQLRVEAGALALATLWARPRRRLIAGRARRRGFRVLASVAATPVTEAEGQMLQRPLLPWWAGPAGLAVLLLVAVVLRPQPEALITIPAAGDGSATDVVASLQRVGLTAETRPEPNDSVGYGRIIRLAPPAGSRVPRGGRVTVYVSSGPRTKPLPERIQAAGEIKVGSIARFGSSGEDLNPFVFPDPGTGRFPGFDDDLSQAMAKRLQVKVRFVKLQHYTWSFRSLSEGDVDLSMSVLRDIGRHQEEVDFVDYLENATVLLVPKGDRNAIRSTDDLCGKTIVRPLETVAGSILADSDRCKARGSRPIALMTCPDVPGAQKPEAEHARLADCPDHGDPLQLLVEGRAQAAMVDSPLAEQALKRSSVFRQSLEVAPRVKLDGGPFGIAVRKGDSQLRDAVQSALRAIIADGTYDQIVRKWGLERLALRTAAVNGGP